MDHWAARGIRGIKVKGLTPEQMRAVIEQTRLRGLTVTSHLYNDADHVNTVSVREAISMVIDRLEHYIVEPARLLDGSIAPGDSEFNTHVQLFLDNDVYFIATVSVYTTLPRPSTAPAQWGLMTGWARSSLARLRTWSSCRATRSRISATLAA